LLQLAIKSLTHAYTFSLTHTHTHTHTHLLPQANALVSAIAAAAEAQAAANAPSSLDFAAKKGRRTKAAIAEEATELEAAQVCGFAIPFWLTL
jgi:type IV secretory pathway VirB9-like protein